MEDVVSTSWCLDLEFRSEAGTGGKHALPSGGTLVPRRASAAAEEEAAAEEPHDGPRGSLASWLTSL